jgi:hypothetical protein
VGRWLFYHDWFGQWHWQLVGRAGAVVLESERGFKTQPLCVADAQMWGYGGSAVLSGNYVNAPNAAG